MAGSSTIKRCQHVRNYRRHQRKSAHHEMENSDTPNEACFEPMKTPQGLSRSTSLPGIKRVEGIDWDTGEIFTTWREKPRCCSSSNGQAPQYLFEAESDQNLLFRVLLAPCWREICHDGVSCEARETATSGCLALHQIPKRSHGRVPLCGSRQ